MFFRAPPEPSEDPGATRAGRGPEMALLPGDDGPYVFESRFPESAQGVPLLDYLVGRFTYRDRAEWSEIVTRGDVSVSGRVVVDPSEPVAPEGVLQCLNRGFVEDPVPTDWRVVALGEDWVAVSKPSGMPIHSTPRIYRQTLVWQVRKLFGQELSPVHRIDRDTSGLVLFSRGRKLTRWLNDAFARRRVAKEYFALVQGAVGAEILVDGAIGPADDPEIGLRQRVRADGKEASTRIVPIGVDGADTWVRVHPLQGRMHQIRVHCESIGHPIVGDPLYDGRGGERYKSRARGENGSGSVPRLMLHAFSLEFAFPPPGTLPRRLVASCEFLPDMDSRAREW